MNMKNNHFSILIILVVFNLTGCQWIKSLYEGDNNSATQGTLFVATSDKKTDLQDDSDDPLSYFIKVNTMLGLTAFERDGQEFKIFPALAREWTIDSTQKHYTFYLRDGLKWSDDKPLKAQEFISVIEKKLQSTNPLEEVEFLFVLKNAREFYEGKTKSFSDVGAKAVDEKTLFFELNEPYSPFLSLWAHPSLFPVHENDKLAQLGPYKVIKFQSGKRIILAENESYFGKKPRIKTINIRLGVSSNDLQKLYKNKQADLIFDNSTTESHNRKGLFEELKLPRYEIVYLSFNIKEKLMSNPVVRHAVGLVFNRGELIRNLGIAALPMSTVIPPGFVGYESNRGTRFDSEAGRTLLGKAGVREPSKYKLTIAQDPSIPTKDLAEKVSELLKANLGFDIRVVDDMKNASIALRILKMKVADADGFMTAMKEAAHRHLGWKHREFSEYLRLALKESSNIKKEKYYSKAQHILLDQEMPIVPLFMLETKLGVGTRLSEIYPNDLFSLSLREITLE